MLKLVLNNIRKYILHFQTGSTNLLGDETGCSHTWRGVHLKHRNLTLMRNDIVNADDAIAMEDVVDVAGDLRHTVGNLRSNACRCNLLHLTIVLGVVVEELIARHHLGDGEDDSLLTSLVDTLRNLRSLDSLVALVNSKLGTTTNNS